MRKNGCYPHWLAEVHEAQKTCNNLAEDTQQVNAGTEIQFVESIILSASL